jgi:hypothetical protein
MKPSFLVIAIILSFSVFSQDIIEFNSGKIQEVKVVEVSSKGIKYRIDLEDEQSAIYTIRLSKIKKVQYAHGRIDDLSIFKEEVADLGKAHLIGFNMFDLAAQRASIWYELFPTKKRDWSITVPLRYTMMSRNEHEHWHHHYPWIETGLGVNYYILRNNKSNLSFGLEGNYTFRRHTFWQWDPDFAFQFETTENMHHLGFYSTVNYKWNFRPKLGMNFGGGLGWLYQLNPTQPNSAFPFPSQGYSQGKLNIGVFLRL